MQIEKMDTKIPKQTWESVAVLSIITLLIYIPFWFKKIKKVTDTFSTEKALNKGMINCLTIISFIVFFFSIEITIGGIHLSTNVYGIGDMLNIARLLLIIFLSFDLRKILQNKYNLNLNAALTFFLGPIYLQYKINSIADKNNSA